MQTKLGIIQRGKHSSWHKLKIAPVSSFKVSTGTHRIIWHLGHACISFNYLPVTSRSGSMKWFTLPSLRTNGVHNEWRLRQSAALGLWRIHCAVRGLYKQSQLLNRDTSCQLPIWMMAQAISLVVDSRHGPSTSSYGMQSCGHIKSHWMCLKPQLCSVRKRQVK